MEVHFSKGFATIMANRQGLQHHSARAFEMPARRSMIDITDDFRWKIADSVSQWIGENCEGEIGLRFDPHEQWLFIGADNEIDLTMLAVAF